jgi:phage gp29-like protein
MAEAAPIPGVEGIYRHAVAPYPLTDRFPTILGSNLNLTVISAAYRSCTMGYRQQYVDILDELLEREPHGFAVLSQLIFLLAGARLTVRPAMAPKGSKDADLAQENADYVQAAIERIPGRTARFAELLWALYYGLSGQEIMWESTSQGVLPTNLQFIHSRRLAYPDQNVWELHIWDQGAVAGWMPGHYPTEQIYGIRVRDYPHKFIVHAPHVRGDYPTRDGLGRELAFWFALKGMAARGSAQFVERFAKPWALAYYSTQSDGQPRTATGEQGGAGDMQSDIEKADAAIKALGTGSLSGAVLPDSVKVVLEQLKYGMTQKDFISIINAEISKAVLTNTDMTEASPGGSRAATQTRKEGLMEVARYHAANFGDTLSRDLATPIIQLNRPHAAHLIPIIDIAVEEKPDAMSIMKVITAGAAVHMPIDADWAAEQTGMRLIPNEQKGPNGKQTPRMLYPAKAVEEPPFVPPQDPDPEEEAQREADAKAAAEAAQKKQAPKLAQEPQDEEDGA